MALHQTEGAEPIVFAESGPVVLDADLSLKMFPQDVEVDGESFFATTIPAGTSICTWYLHFDGLTRPAAASPSMEFPGQVLGFAPQLRQLTETADFEHPVPGYDYDPIGVQDSIHVSGTTVDLSLSTNSRDQIRIFTRC